MDEYRQRAENIIRRMDDAEDMSPAEELDTFRSVLDELTAMMNEQDTLPGTGSST